MPYPQQAQQLKNDTQNIGDLTKLNTTAKGDMVSALNELFQNVSNGKSSIATAITGKGVSASGSDAFSTLASKITSIANGVVNGIVIDKIQSGTTLAPAANPITVTVNTVDPSKSILIIGTVGRDGPSCYLSSSTTITIGPSAVGVYNESRVYWYLISFVSGVTVQRGNVVLSSTSATPMNTAYIPLSPSIDVANSIAITSADKPDGTYQWDAAAYFQNASTLVVTRGDTGQIYDTTNVAWQVVTFNNNSIPNQGSPIWTPSTTDIAIPAGYYGGGTVKGDADLVASNIKQGVSLFGVTGSMNPVLSATGSLTCNPFVSSPAPSYVISGLSFAPKFVLLKFFWYDTAYAMCYGGTLHGFVVPHSNGFTNPGWVFNTGNSISGDVGGNANLIMTADGFTFNMSITYTGIPVEVDWVAIG